MQHTWINKNDNNTLILFFNGWACDATPFTHLEADNVDVLMLSNYASLDIDADIIEVINSYPKVSIAAWSFGVWVAQHIVDTHSLRVDKAVSFNGTLKPIDADNGIPEAIAFGTLEQLNERSLAKFQRRMLGGGADWQHFQTELPQLAFTEQHKELECLYAHFKANALVGSCFTKAVVAQADMIFSAKHQLNFWSKRTEVQEIEGSHFCFYNYDNWLQLIS